MFVIVAISVGIKIFLKYFNDKNWHYIMVCLTWIGLASPWSGPAINFVLIVFFNTMLSLEVYLMFGNAFLPVFLLFWIIVFTDLFYKEKKLIILGLFSILLVIYEIYFFYFLFTDISMIATYDGPFAVKYAMTFMLFNVIFAAIFLICGVLFALLSLKLDDPVIKLRGKILLIAFISYTVAALLDSITTSFVFITRIILICCALEFYLAFIMPNWFKKFFI